MQSGTVSVCIDLMNVGNKEELSIQVAQRGSVLLCYHHKVKLMLTVWNELSAETAENIANNRYLFF